MTLFAVGDVDQLMYRFAGAKPELMTAEVDKYIPNINTLFLDVNYRSTQTIIDACSRLIANNYSDLGGPYAQEFMKLTQARPDAPEGEPIVFQMYADQRSEAMGVADTVVDLIGNHGYAPGDFFIGTRTRAQLAYVEGPLFRAGVKFINLTGGSFWQSYHVANILAYLKLAFDQTDDAAFGRVYNIASAEMTDRKGDYCNHRWMGAEFMKLTQGKYSLMHLAIQKNRRYTDGVADLQSFVQEIQGEIAYSETAAEPINFIIENCYRQWLKAKGETMEEDADSNIADDIATILDVAGQYSVEDFLAYVAEMEKAAEDAKNGDMSQMCVISTYHRLKGMERKVMIGMGWAEGRNAHDEPRGLLPITWAMVPPPQYGVLPTGGMALMEDERCIGFVAVSRAKERVILTAPGMYRDAMMFPSRFVAELGIELPKEVDEETE